MTRATAALLLAATLAACGTPDSGTSATPAPTAIPPTLAPYPAP